MIPLPTERTPRERLGLFFLIWTGCFLLFSLLSQGFLMAYLGKDAYNEFANSTTLSIQHVHIIRYLQIILSIGIFGIPPILLMLLSKPRDWSLFGLNRIPGLQLIFLTILIAAFSLPVVSWAVDVNQAFKFPSVQLENYMRDMQTRDEQFLTAILNMESVYAFVLNFLMIAIIPPLVEELLFRGTMQPLIQKALGPHVAIILTGAFFSFVHMDFYGFFPRMLLGIMFGYLFYWSRSLWVPILAHFLHNGLQVVVLYLFQREMIKTDIEQESFPPYMVIGATILLFTTLYIFDRVTTAQIPQTPQDGERLGESLRDE